MSALGAHWPDVKTIRRELGLTQRELSQLAGVSLRTIQSCEQGWRAPGACLEKCLLLLLMACRWGQQFGAARCWERQNCAQEQREQCIVYVTGQGYLCWFLTGTKCSGRPLHDWAEKKAVCQSCLFFKFLLMDDDAGSGD